MDTAYIIGITGAIILLIAWLTSLVRTFRSKKHTVDPIFTAIYFLASGLLTLYSVLIRDQVFSILNGVATLIALIEFGAYLYFRTRR